MNSVVCYSFSNIINVSYQVCCYLHILNVYEQHWDIFLFRVDSWFSRITQALARDKTTGIDSKEDIRYSVKKINQYLYSGRDLFFHM